VAFAAHVDGTGRATAATLLATPSSGVGGGSGAARAIAADGAGAAFVGGWFAGSAAFGGVALTSASTARSFLAKAGRCRLTLTNPP
jgi:hypothetical protein